MWPSVKKSLEYAWKYWDADRDGVMEGLQHNTYDIEFYGPNTMMGSLYVGALAAGARMAREMGQQDTAACYEALARRGGEWMDAELFNGEFYIQRIDPDADRLSPVATDVSMGGQEKDEHGQPKYQFGTGCLIDQLFGQALAALFGLGHLFDERNVKKALASLFRYNWKADLTDHANPERVFATEGEAGMIICTWPKGGRPRLPFVYADEVMTGFEYQVAVHLINEGFLDEGLSVVRGIRQRYDGRYRNPFNEVECGNHYVRALANWGLVIALSGFTFDAPERTYGFAPKLRPDDFRTFWSTGTGWGTFAQQVTKEGGAAELSALHGRLDVKRLSLSVGGGGGSAKILKGKEEIPGRIETSDGGVVVLLDAPVTVGAGEALRIEFSG
jgi:uncharacterized protein (DUF608 family)